MFGASNGEDVGYYRDGGWVSASAVASKNGFAAVGSRRYHQVLAAFDAR